MTTWLPADGGFTPGGMDTAMSGTWEPQAELNRLSYSIPPFPQPPRLPHLAGTSATAVAVPGHGSTPSSPPLPGLSQRLPGPFYHPLAPPPGAPIAGFGSQFLGLSGLTTGLLSASPGSGFSTSSSLAGREEPALPAGPALQTATASASPSDPSVPANLDCTTTFTPALVDTDNASNASNASSAAARQHRYPSSSSAVFSAQPSSANSTSAAASLSNAPQQTSSLLPQSLVAANGRDDFDFAELATAESSLLPPDSSRPFFTAAALWPCGYFSDQPSAQLPTPTPRTFTPLHQAHPGLEAQTESSSSPQEQYGRAQHEGGRLAHLDHDDTDENGRIPVDSLLEAMPAPNPRKRTRTAAAVDEPAGPSNVKRSRSHSSRASVSARPTSSRARKSTRGAPPVVIPDSDDVFAVDDDDQQQLFDLTKDDHIPEELMAAPNEDNENSTKLSAFECIICMDSATNLTVTHCGHMFCGQCLHQAMHAEVTKKICPMCRQKLELRPKTGTAKPNAKTFFHLELKLKPSKKQGKQPVRR